MRQRKNLFVYIYVALDIFRDASRPITEYYEHTTTFARRPTCSRMRIVRKC